MRRKEFVQELTKLVGLKGGHYRGPLLGDTENGFDCSQFVIYVLRSVLGYQAEIPRHCNEMFDEFGLLVHAECRLPGDLVFFSRDGCVPRHVGIMVSEHDYIHSPGKRNSLIKISRIKPKQFPLEVDSGRLYVEDPIGFKRIVTSCGRYKQGLFCS